MWCSKACFIHNFLELERYHNLSKQMLLSRSCRSILPTGAVSDAAALRFPEAAAWTGVDGITGFHVRGMALGLGPGHQDDTPRPQKLPTQTSSLPSSVRDNIAYFCS